MTNHYPNNIIFHGQEIKSRISIKDEFKVERKAMRLLAKDNPLNVYFRLEKQEQYSIEYCEEDDVFIDAQGDILEDNEYNFILTCEKNPKLICGQFHHSYMANGKKVLASGTLLFEGGALVRITNNSGHYRPTDNEMLDVIKALYKLTGGTLTSYESYSTKEHLIYPVSELVTVNDFSLVLPLQSKETINRRGIRLRTYGYDEQIRKDGVLFRFGCGLKKELASQYSEVIEASSCDEIMESINL